MLGHERGTKNVGFGAGNLDGARYSGGTGIYPNGSEKQAGGILRQGGRARVGAGDEDGRRDIGEIDIDGITVAVAHIIAAPIGATVVGPAIAGERGGVVTVELLEAFFDAGFGDRDGHVPGL